MTQIVIDLKKCLEIEMARNISTSDMIGSTEIIELRTINSESGPLDRY